ncbi:MAG: hypothetical protein HYS27_07235 [Deltaproteobacteria bacterium]|nr:hypothetical protein [Deltaproteobacteria bacterium]
MIARWRSWLFSGAALVAVTSAGCRVGPSSSLLDDANVQVVVAGLDGGEALTIDVDDQHRRLDQAPADVVVVYLTLPEGVHRGLATIAPSDVPARCAPFDVEVLDGDERTVVAVAADRAPPCAPIDAGPDAGEPDAGEPDAGEPDAGEPDAGEPDAGPPPDVFVRLEEEEQVVGCIIPPCARITTVTADGTITYVDQGAAPRTGLLDALDLRALAARSLSAEADALFAGADAACPQLPPLDGLVVLRRTYDPGTGAVQEQADVSLCVTGVAVDLRARLALARAQLGL